MVHVADHVDHVYYDPRSKEQSKHRRAPDDQDRNTIAEVEKYPHPLEDKRSDLYNTVTGQIASVEVNVANSVMIGEKNESNYIASLLDVFSMLSVVQSKQCIWSRESRKQQEQASNRF